MVRNLYLVVVMSMFFAVAILVGSSAWKIWQAAFDPLMKALSGIH
jgi:hypothetical protein